MFWAKQIASLACAASMLATPAVGQRAASAPEQASAAPAETYAGRAALGVNALQKWYDAGTGLYKTTGWWNSANATTVLVDYARATGSHAYDGVLANTFQAAQKTSAGFLNNFFDDEGWWALAWIDAWDLTGKQEYLAMAESIFADMAKGWDQTCGGGIWWSKDRGYKNAIANELFLSVSAHLANRDKKRSAEFLDWANKEWGWFERSGMINESGLINDGLSKSCANNGKTTWSYNQGVVLGGLSELAKLRSDSSLGRQAARIAHAAITQLVDAQGVMHDPCEPKCGADGVQFKGIFVRNLAALEKFEPHAEYVRFIEANADAVWRHAQGPGHTFGVVWSGPSGEVNAGSQSSALDALVAAAGLGQEGSGAVRDE